MLALGTIRLIFYGSALLILLLSGLYLRVEIRHVDELRIKLSEEQHALAEQRAEHDRIVNAMQTSAQQAAEQARRNGEVLVNILSAPHTQACADSPAVRRLLEQLRVPLGTQQAPADTGKSSAVP